MVRTVATTETPAGNVILRLSLKACPELAEGMTKNEGSLYCHIGIRRHSRYGLPTAIHRKRRPMKRMRMRFHHL